MKQNDFEYIRNKFDESGVNAPEELGEREIYEKLRDVQPLAEVSSPEAKKRRVNKKVLYPVSAAAAIALISATAFGLNGLFGSINIARQRDRLGLSNVEDYEGLRAFSSRADLTSAVRNVRRLQSGLDSITSNEYMIKDGEVLEYGDGGESRAYDSFSSSSGSNSATGSSGGDSFGGTYLQYNDVDEADTVKTDGRYIYRLTSDSSDINGFPDSCIRIFNADPEKPEQVAKLIPGKTAKAAVGDDFIVSAGEFFVHGDRLIVLEETVNATTYSGSDTRVQIFDISDINNITEAGCFMQSGSYTSSRMIGDTLYIVSNQYIESENDVPMVGQPKSTVDEPEMTELDPGCIYAPSRPTSASYLVVSRIDVASGVQATETKAMLGSAGVVNCNADNLYVATYDYDPMIYDYIIAEDADALYEYGDGFYRGHSNFSDSTRIYKLNLGEQLAFTADGAVNGTVKDQYALDEKDGMLRVTTTSYNSDLNEVNNLYVLDSDLKQIGAVTGFAENESVKAVRYVGDTAYVITYEQTDPLFVIDLSDPTSPTLLGEVKISGFSTMLVPIDDNTLLGIGYHTEMGDEIAMETQNGLKLVVFDVSDRANPKVLDTKIFASCYSEVQYNPRALLFNPERNDYTIPFGKTEWLNGDSIPEDADAYWMPDYKMTTGVINFKVENGKLVITDEYASDMFNNENCEGTVERCVYVGNTVYMIGSVQNKDDYSDLKTIVDATAYK